jgi:GNAT superfamily N-acetyltransferase
MPELSAVARFFAAMDSLLEKVERTWWGAVATDSRFPDVFDLNYARVDTGQPDLRLHEVEAALLPALRSSGARAEHVVVFEPEGCHRLVDDLERAGHEVASDTAMEFGGPDPSPPEGHEVRQLDPHSDELWAMYELVLIAFDAGGADVRRQLRRWAADVLVPAGRRWFAAGEPGDVRGMGSIHVLGGVGYIDDVLTLRPYRKQGIASAIVCRAVREARAQGADHVVLLTDNDDARRLYARLGFADRGRVVSATARLKRSPQDSGSSGSA